MGFGVSKLVMEKGNMVSVETLRKLECKVCPLNAIEKKLNHPKMPPSGIETPLFYVVGEAPGAEEDRQGEPFVGDSGMFLKTRLHSIWYDRLGKYVERVSGRAFIDYEYLKGYFRFNNTIRCRPPNNRPPTWQETECCRPSLERDLLTIRPSVVICVGGSALSWFIGEDKIMSWRGQRVPMQIGDHKFWLFPVVHPSALLRSGAGINTIRRVQDDRFFMSDLAGAIDFGLELLDGKEIKHPDFPTEDIEKLAICLTGKEPDDLNKAIELFEYFKSVEFVAFDIETSGERGNKDRALRPYGENAALLSLAISDGKRFMAVAIDHPGAGWNQLQHAKLKELIIGFLESKVTKIAHNLSYELEWLGYFLGSHYFHSTNWGDSMAQAYVLGVKPGAMSLDNLCLMRLGTRMKNLVKVDRGNLRAEKVEKVLLYNVTDAYFTYPLYLVQDQLIRDQGLVMEGVYKEQVRRIPTVVLAQLQGLLIDQDRTRKFSTELSDKIENARESLKSFSFIKQFERRMVARFNPGSSDDVTVLLRDIMKKKEGYRGPGKYCTDKEVLENIGGPICEAILQYRELSKLKSTYVDGMLPESKKYLWPDGKIHSKFNTLFVYTRRLSSDDPNGQNFPARKNKNIRSQVVAPKGHTFVSCDYGQIEAKVIAMASNDSTFKKALWERLDIHMYWAERVAKKYPKALDFARKLNDKEEVMLVLRQETKNKFVFPAFYGAGGNSISENFHLPVSITNELLEEFWCIYPDVRKWQSRVIKSYEEKGYIELLTGFRVHGPLKKSNAVINVPIQGTASDIVVDAMNRLSEKAQHEKLSWFQPVLNIHDDLSFIIPNDVLDDSIDAIITEMLSSEFDFVNVPLTVEVSAGLDWYNKEKLGTFHSDLWMK